MKVEIVWQWPGTPDVTQTIELAGVPRVGEDVGWPGYDGFRAGVVDSVIWYPSEPPRIHVDVADWPKADPESQDTKVEKEGLK